MMRSIVNSIGKGMTSIGKAMTSCASASESKESRKMNLGLLADQSTGWWQATIQDALDAFACDDTYAPSERVVVTNSQAREVKAKCINFMAKHGTDGKLTSVILPVNCRMIVGDKKYSFGYQFSIKRFGGVKIPVVQIYTDYDMQKSVINNERTRVHDSYKDCYNYILKMKKESEEFLNSGTDVVVKPKAEKATFNSHFGKNDKPYNYKAKKDDDTEDEFI